jgi:hypothetical protein
MEKNKTGKYFKYAVGEIVLVVIGILIAVSINGIVNDYSNSKKETKYLLAFNKDILDMESKLDITKTSLVSIKMACDSLIKIVHQPELIYNAKRLNPLTSKMITIPSDMLVFQSYNNIKNTSDLNLIKSDELKLSLSDIEMGLNKLVISREWQNKQWTDINQVYINENMDLMDIANNDSDLGEYSENMESIFKNNWDEILKDREFSNILINRKWALLDIIEDQDRLKKALDESQRLIQKELEKN